MIISFSHVWRRLAFWKQQQSRDERMIELMEDTVQRMKTMRALHQRIYNLQEQTNRT